MKKLITAALLMLATAHAAAGDVDYPATMHVNSVYCAKLDNYRDFQSAIADSDVAAFSRLVISGRCITAHMEIKMQVVWVEDDVAVVITPSGKSAYTHPNFLAK